MSGSCKHQKRCGLLLLRLLHIFLNKIYIKKKNDYGDTLAMGYLAPENVFENVF